MPLIACPECKKEFSDQARACPNCGKPWKEFSLPPFYVVVGILALLGLVIAYAWHNNL